MNKKRQLVFICYLNRSGSTFLGNCLSNSKEICVCPESDKLVSSLLEFNNTVFSARKLLSLASTICTDPKFIAWPIQQAEIEKILTAGMTGYECFKTILDYYADKLKPDANYVVFKAERLIHLYPVLRSTREISWLALIRDPRGVFNSQRKTEFPDTGKTMSVNPLITAWLWKRFVQKCIAYQENTNFKTLQFELLIKQLTATLAEITHFLGTAIVSDNAKGELFSRLPGKHKKIHLKIIEPPDLNVISNWQNELDSTTIYTIERMAGNEMQGYNYMQHNTSGKFNLKTVSEYTRFYFYIFLKFSRKIIFKVESFKS